MISLDPLGVETELPLNKVVFLSEMILIVFSIYRLSLYRLLCYIAGLQSKLWRDFPVDIDTSGVITIKVMILPLIYGTT